MNSVLCQPETAPVSPRRESPPRSALPRVLLVDGSPVQQLLVCTLLSRWGIMPALAHDGIEAVLLAGEQDFDLILMAVDMPVMDGPTATLLIRRHEHERRGARRVPVVACCAGHPASDEGRWRLSGMDAVLAKSCDALEMCECLEHWCPGELPKTPG